MPVTSSFSTTIQNWQKYANAGDTKSIRALYQTDAVALFTEGTDPPGNPSAMIQGADAIVADLGKHFGPGNPYQQINLVEVASQQQGNSGWSYGTWTAIVGGNTQPGSWSVIWVQGSGNTPWLIQVHAVVPYVPEQ
jgi:ketosteroid isomerase-like protein